MLRLLAPMGSLRNWLESLSTIQTDLVGSVRTRDLAVFREDSEQLEDFRRGDFSSMSAELRELFPNDPPPQRFFNLVDRFAKELADLYVRPPLRSFDGLRSAEAAAAADAYLDSDVNGAMALISEQAVVHNSAIVAIDPAPPGELRGLVQSFVPADVLEIEYADPMRARGPIADASKVVLRVPLKTEAVSSDRTAWPPGTDQVLFGQRIYTATEAYTLWPNDERRGIYRDDLTHDFGRVPLVGVRRHSPMAGWWLPPLPWDLLSVAIGLNVGLSDVLYIASQQCHGSHLWWGNGATSLPEEVVSGPGFDVCLEVNDPAELAHEYVQGDPKIEKYLAAIDKAIEYFATNRSITPTSLTKSTAVTGEGVEAEMRDRERERRRVEAMMATFERDFARLMVDTLRQRNPVFSAGARPSVRVDYRYVEAPANDLQKAQAQEIRYRQLLDSTEETIAREQGVSLDGAAELAVTRLESLRRRLDSIGDGPTPGLDRTDNAIPR